MKKPLPDPLALWIQASSISNEQSDSDTILESLIGLWGNQEETLRSIGSMLGKTQITELAIETFMVPLRRQAQLLSQVAVSDPQQVLLLQAALNNCLVAQVDVARAATEEVQEHNSNTIVQAWFQAFDKQQNTYLASEAGRCDFARLCQAWLGFKFKPKRVIENSSPITSCCINEKGNQSTAESKKKSLLLFSYPWCPLLPFSHLENGLLVYLAHRFELHVVEWGGLQHVECSSELRCRLSDYIKSFREQHDCYVLDLSGGSVLTDSPMAGVFSVRFDAVDKRLEKIMSYFNPAQLGFGEDDLPSELIAILVDSIYPDWAARNHLEGEMVCRSALDVRRQCFSNLPTLSAALFADLWSDSRLEPKLDSVRWINTKNPQSLFQLLNGNSSEQIRAAIREA